MCYNNKNLIYLATLNFWVAINQISKEHIRKAIITQKYL